MKKYMTNELGAIALPFIAPTVGAFQGTSVSAHRSTGITSGFGGAGLRLRARDRAIAPDSVPGGPVI